MAASCKSAAAAAAAAAAATVAAVAPEQFVINGRRLIQRALVAHPTAPAVIMGLDISTTCTGIALMDTEGHLLDSVAVQRPKNASGVFEIADAVCATMRQLHNKHSVTVVAIEEFMKAFASGRFHTQGLFKLAQLNGIVSYQARDIVGVEPVLYMPNAVRSGFGLAKSPDLPIKKVVHQFVSTVLNVPVRRTIRGGVHSSSYDVSDAVLVAMHHVVQRRKQALWQPQLFRQFAAERSDCAGKSTTNDALLDAFAVAWDETRDEHTEILPPGTTRYFQKVKKAFEQEVHDVAMAVFTSPTQ